MSEAVIKCYLFIYAINLTESKRLRKPSKRLLEWNEDYEQIFISKKKAKKTPESSKTVSKPYVWVALALSSAVSGDAFCFLLFF